LQQLYINAIKTQDYTTMLLVGYKTNKRTATLCYFDIFDIFGPLACNRSWFGPSSVNSIIQFFWFFNVSHPDVFF